MTKATPLTATQRTALADLAVAGGEAIRQKPWFEAGGKIICEVGVMERLERKRMVRIEIVGASAFATITDRGRVAAARRALQPSPA